MPTFPIQPPLSAEHLRSIGLVTVQWSYLEAVIEFGLWGLLSLTQFKGRNVTTHIGHITRIEILMNLIGEEPGAEAREELAALVKQIEVARIDRNKIAHAVYIDGGEPKYAHAMRHTARSGLKTKVDFLTTEQIDAIANNILKVRVELQEFLDRYSLVPPSADDLFPVPDSWADS